MARACAHGRVYTSLIPVGLDHGLGSIDGWFSYSHDCAHGVSSYAAYDLLCIWCLFLCSIRLCLGLLNPCLVLCLVFPYSNDEFVLKLWQNSTYSFGTFKHIKQSVTSLPFFSWRYFWIFLSSCSNLDWRMYRTVTQLLTLTSLHHHFEKSLELSSVGLPVTWIWSLFSCYLPWLDGVHPLEAF